MLPEFEKLLMEVIRTIMKGFKILFFIWLGLISFMIIGSLIVFLLGYFGVI